MCCRSLTISLPNKNKEQINYFFKRYPCQPKQLNIFFNSITFALVNIRKKDNDTVSTPTSWHNVVFGKEKKGLDNIETIFSNSFSVLSPLPPVFRSNLSVFCLSSALNQLILSKCPQSLLLFILCFLQNKKNIWNNHNPNETRKPKNFSIVCIYFWP